MKKVALVFVLAVLAPSLVLAWLAFRSLRDQQFIVERQQSLLYQGVADVFAKEVTDVLAEELRGFTLEVDLALLKQEAGELAQSFDEKLRARWPLAEIGFAVTTNGALLSPGISAGQEARDFISSNGKFLCNTEVAQVYWNTGKIQVNNYANNDIAQQQVASNASTETTSGGVFNGWLRESAPQKFANKAQSRNVVPQQTINYDAEKSISQGDNLSRLNPSEAEFRQLIGDAAQGTVARFVDNRLALLFWYRPGRAPGTVFGAQISIKRLKEDLRGIFDELKQPVSEDICVAILDDNAKPAAMSRNDFQTNWKRPFAATEIGETLPHWEVAVYLLDPGKLSKAAHTAKLTLGLLIVTLVFAIGAGSWLIVRDLNRELNLARQKTDFVSNVSHELKTPLTSIRMFSELLAEGRVGEPEKQKNYLRIITAETARLTRLINNVLDFARMERGEKKYNLAACDLAALVRETAETYRPHLESTGFQFSVSLPEKPVPVRVDRDAVAQIIVNLLSNAEKYSNGAREIEIITCRCDTPLPHAEMKVLDRGSGVPQGSEEKIFEQFYRAHDSLGSGIQGSGLGLTLARQIARAHGGDVRYEPREGGGSSFALRLPLQTE